MRTGAVQDAPRAADREGLRLLREALAGYTPKRLEAAFGFEGTLHPNPSELPFHLRALAGGGALATLVLLFQLEVAVDAADAERALAPAPLDRLAEAGFLVREGATVRSTVALSPFAGLVLASDWEPEDSAPTRPDHVLGLSAPSRLLACLGVREPAGAALDVGTGCGLQALLAARHSETVVATDVNPRALRFTELNAALNGIDNVVTREGSLLEPVEGERFELASSNPPYIISPDTAYSFRDSGLPGDSFCEALVRGLPGHLAEGGVAHMLASWAHGANEDWSAPLRRWLDGSGCDAILLRWSSQEPLEYASGWNRIAGLDPAAYDETLARWLAYYESLGIERIGWGAIALRRRRAGPNRVCAADVLLTELGPSGHHLLRLLDAEAYLAALGGEEGLLGERLALAPDCRLDQTLRFRNGGGEVEQVALRLDGGLSVRVDLDPWSPRALAELDEGRTVGDVLAEAAGLRASSPAERDRIAASALASVRRLVELGFLVPAEDGTA